MDVQKVAIFSRGLREFHADEVRTVEGLNGARIRLGQTIAVGELPNGCPHRYHWRNTAEVGCIEPFAA